MSDATEGPQRDPAPLGPSAQARYERAVRRVRVAHGLAAHKSYREIAREEGCDLATIARDVKVLHRYWQIRSNIDVDAAIAGELATLDLYEREVIRQLQMDHVLVSHGKVIPNVVDEGAKLAALDRGLRVQLRRAQLRGYDKPTRTEAKLTVEHTTELDAEIERLMELMPRAESADANADG